jgi:Na+/serine symporter
MMHGKSDIKVITFCTIVVDNVYWVNRRRNYTVIVTVLEYWQKHYSFHTVANGATVYLRLSFRCWLNKYTFTVRIIIGEMKSAAREIYATGYGAF